ncbi:MAG TPA: hypothetical protein EYH34_15490 [Planctomycetes bacterium]|nr:hypothetical protein [Planctomycetota bacterium]
MWRLGCIVLVIGWGLGSELVGKAWATNGALDQEEAAVESPEATPTEGRDEAAVFAELWWLTDYAAATERARREAKRLFIYFQRPGNGTCREFEEYSLSDRAVMESLRSFVRLKVPIDVKIEREGSRVKLLGQSAYREMLGRPGVAIVDWASQGQAFYGKVVSTFPFLGQEPYGPEEVLAMLQLPPATLTQRTLIYAVRTHPDRPASTDGKLDPYLCQEAELHATYQARIRLQGHHNWERRFHRINRTLPRGLVACEVCAESWPGQNLVEAAIECVRCWRLSSGHWSAVREKHAVYGYDMKRGRNGVWYATGIFGRRW